MESGEGAAVVVSSPRDRGDQGDHEGQGHVKQEPSPPPVEEKAVPEVEPDAEVFCGRIPKEVTEAELKTLFAAFGPIKDVRMPKFPVTATHKGFAFINFQRQEDAAKAISKMNGRQVRHRQYLKVTRCLPNTRLFVGNIPKAKGNAELFREFATRASGLKEVIIYSSPDDGKKNRGFCFLDYESHKAAASAKRRLSTRDSKIFGCDIMVDWADPEQEVDDVTMSKVQIIYARNISALVTEDELRRLFEPFGPLDRVKKIKDFAFIHFATRNDAAKAKEALHGQKLRGVPIELQWAKPPTSKEMRQQMLRAREKRILVQHYLKPPRGIVNPFPLPPVTWDDDAYARRDRGDHQGNRGLSPIWSKRESTSAQYLAPAEAHGHFFEGPVEVPFEHWAMIQHQLPRVPSHLFLLSDDEDHVTTTFSGGFNRSRNKFSLAFPGGPTSSQGADEIQNWRVSGHSSPPPPPQRHREWTNQSFKGSRRLSKAEEVDNWRVRP